MVTEDERRALVFLAVVAAVGGGVRLVRPDPGRDQAAVAAVAPDLADGDPVRQAARSRQAEERARPLAPGERVDVDRATAEDLARLPRVGPALARRIVEERDAHGPFRGLAGLARVAGIGPRLLGALEGHVLFGGAISAPGVGAGTGERGAAVPGIGGGAAAADAAPSRLVAVACPERVAVNRASAAQLICLPGIGPALAARIVAERTARGNFSSVADLARVRGLGSKRRERLRGRVIIP
jgi:competence ComEA-like helix-hairpin-helix protein